MPNISAALITDAFCALAAVYALRVGGPAERLTAIIVLINVVIQEVSVRLFPATDPIVRLANDGLTATALLIVTIRYGAPWMGGVMFFFAAQFSLHSFYLVTNRHNDRLHAIINNVDWAGVAWCLIIGASVVWRQRVVRGRRASAA